MLAGIPANSLRCILTAIDQRYRKPGKAVFVRDNHLKRTI